MGFFQFFIEFLQRTGFFIGGFVVMIIGGAILYTSSIGFLFVILGIAMIVYAGKSRN